MEVGMVWVGVDVGRYSHALCAIDASGSVIWERKRVLNTTWAMRRVLAKLLHFLRGRPVHFAVEEPNGNAAALVRLLTADDLPVLLAQPLRVYRFHLALGQPHKSDPYDAQVIAQFARQNASKLPPVRILTPTTQSLRVLSRRADAVGKDMRRCLSRLRGVLAEYAPSGLRVESSGTGPVRRRWGRSSGMGASPSCSARE